MKILTHKCDHYYFFSLTNFFHFNKHSLDGATITAEQFARILLSHTNYDRDEVIARLSREPPVCVQVSNSVNIFVALSRLVCFCVCMCE